MLCPPRCLLSSMYITLVDWLFRYYFSSRILRMSLPCYQVSQDFKCIRPHDHDAVTTYTNFIFVPWFGTMPPPSFSFSLLFASHDGCKGLLSFLSTFVTAVFSIFAPTALLERPLQPASTGWSCCGTLLPFGGGLVGPGGP